MISYKNKGAPKKLLSKIKGLNNPVVRDGRCHEIIYNPAFRIFSVIRLPIINFNFQDLSLEFSQKSLMKYNPKKPREHRIKTLKPIQSKLWSRVDTFPLRGWVLE